MLHFISTMMNPSVMWAMLIFSLVAVKAFFPPSMMPTLTFGILYKSHCFFHLLSDSDLGFLNFSYTLFFILKIKLFSVKLGFKGLNFNIFFSLKLALIVCN